MAVVIGDLIRRVAKLPVNGLLPYALLSDWPCFFMQALNFSWSFFKCSQCFLAPSPESPACAPEVGMAVTDKEKGSHGISAFVIERGMPGFRPGKKENKLGMRASDTSEVVFSDCRVADSQLLGVEGEGFINSLQVLDGGRISIAALGLGMARGAFEAAAKYARQRKQFGRAIAEFQAIQFKLADMETEIEAARLLVYQAAWLADRKDARFTRESSMAKLYASEVAVRVANEAVQIHGGYGFIKDYPAEKFYRDVKLCTIGEGTSEIQRLVIARQLLGKK